MRCCNVSMRVEGSRMPDLAHAIEMQVKAGDLDILRQIAESAADPRDFIKDPDRHRAVIDHLNAYLSRRFGASASRSGSAMVTSAMFPGVRTTATSRPRASARQWSFVVLPPRETPTAWANSPLFRQRRSDGL